MNLIQRAVSKMLGLEPKPYGISKESRGTLGDYVLGQDPRYGQPRLSRGDMYSGGTYITNGRMREIALKSDTVASITNAILDFCIPIPMRAVPMDSGQTPPRNKILKIEHILRHPNPQTNGTALLRALLRDITILGYGALEVVHSSKGLELWNIDAGRLSIDYDQHGTILGYDQLDALGMPIRGPDGLHGWDADEIIFFSHDAVSWSLYPLGRVEQLYTAAIVESLMLNFIGMKFTDSNVPFGVFDLGDLTDTELQDAISRWEEQADSPHRLVLTGSRGGSKFINFHDDLQRLEAPALLNDVRTRIMSVYGATTNELAFALKETSSSADISYTFKKRCVEPFLATIASTLTARLLHDILGYSDLEFMHDEIDSKDELIETQIKEILLKAGAITINEVRSSKQLAKVPGGDTPYLYTPTGAIPVVLLEDMAKAQLASVQAAARQAVAGAKSVELQNKATQAGMNPDGTPTAQSLVTTPSPRTARPPDEGGTPDGSKGGGTTIRLPKPNQAVKPAKPGAPSGVKAPPAEKPAHSMAIGEKSLDEEADEENDA